MSAQFLSGYFHGNDHRGRRRNHPGYDGAADAHGHFQAYLCGGIACGKCLLFLLRSPWDAAERSGAAWIRAGVCDPHAGNEAEA